jgi:hypothetical protein
MANFRRSLGIWSIFNTCKFLFLYVFVHNHGEVELITPWLILDEEALPTGFWPCSREPLAHSRRSHIQTTPLPYFILITNTSSTSIIVWHLTTKCRAEPISKTNDKRLLIILCLICGLDLTALIFSSYLTANKFTGRIPDTFDKLIHLKTLWVFL